MNTLLEYLIAEPVTVVSAVLGLVPALLGLLYILWNPKLFLLGLKNLRRNLLRTSLTALATMVLVFMVTLIWTVVFFLDQITAEKSRDMKLIVTERWLIPSQLPLTHANYLNPERPECIIKEYIGRNDFMTWSFYGGTLDPNKMTRDNLIFFFVMDPRYIRTMMDDLENFDPALVKKLQDKRQACLMGRERLEAIDKRVGERFKVTSINYKGIDLEFEIVGELPDGRYNMSAIMNDSYFNEELDRYARQKGQKHPLDEKRLNLVWLRVRDRETFARVADRIESAKELTYRPVRCETASSGVATFLEAYRDLLWGMKWILVPAILVSMALVMANAISISVRERRTEMAVLKVLGYPPRQILGLVLGESLLVGGSSGFLAGAATYGIVNILIGGVKFPIAFFPAFMVPGQALLWGLAMGFTTALLGSFWPAWGARSVKVSEVFAKVA